MNKIKSDINAKGFCEGTKAKENPNKKVKFELSDFNNFYDDIIIIKKFHFNNILDDSNILIKSNDEVKSKLINELGKN